MKKETVKSIELYNHIISNYKELLSSCCEAKSFAQGLLLNYGGYSRSWHAFEKYHRAIEEARRGNLEDCDDPHPGIFDQNTIVLFKNFPKLIAEITKEENSRGKIHNYNSFMVLSNKLAYECVKHFGKELTR